MQVFVNDREVADLAAARSTIGELVEALGVHVDPSEVLTSVALDDEVFSAGDDARYAGRPAAGVRRLTLTTSTIAVLAASLRSDAQEGLLSIVVKLERVTDALGRGEPQVAFQVLAAALDELRLVLLLDEHTVQLAGGAALTSQADLTPLAEDLLAALSRADRGATRILLAERLLPLLRGWSATAAAGAGARGGKLVS